METKQQQLDELNKKIKECQNCILRYSCTQVVPGEGSAGAEIMFIGEGPGQKEDELGIPFVGAAGKFLDEMLGIINLKREQVYIANVVKCRPPENRTPRPDEVKACSPYLLHQIELINPKSIVALGKISAEFLLQTNKSMSEIRGHFGQFKGIPVMPTFHPAYLIRNEGNREIKRLVWEDMKKVMKLLETS